MRLACYGGAGPATFVGLVSEDEIVPVFEGPLSAAQSALLEFAVATAAPAPIGPPMDPSTVSVLAPVPVPPSIRDFYAFEAHVATARSTRGLEMEPDWYELPVFYFSNPAAVIGSNAPVAAPHGSVELDYELEVAAIVGRDARDLPPDASALAVIAGFTIMNDWSARDLQRREMRLGLGPAKGKDFATSLGPVLVTPDELPGFSAGRPSGAMVARVNGVEYSRGELSDIHFSWASLLSYASRSTTLHRGDVIGSGTVGTGCILELSAVHGREQYPWLRSGDVVELEVDGLGVLVNSIS